jgi:drug/metabolite transporter (DMT)-like permease
MDRRPLVTGALSGAGAALCWAAGFVVAKHGVSIGFAPADLAFHRFFWSAWILAPAALKDGFRNLGGLGWTRGIVVSVLSGPPQALIAYSGFILVPLGHGTTIQPACAALSGILLASVLLREKLTARRIAGAAGIIVGLLVFGAEALATIGTHGVGGDLLFVTAGVFWGLFGVLLRLWQISGQRAIGVTAILSIVVYAPAYLIIYGVHDFIRMGLWENLLQIVTQGVIAGALPVFLFARAVALLGAGRASTFPAMVPVFGVIIGFLGLGIVPSLAQLAGMAIVLIGFRLALG